MSEDITMWSYCLEKYGSIEDMVEECYPNLLASSVQLQTAIAQIKNNKYAIANILDSLEGE